MSKEAELKKNDQQEQQKGFTMERQQVLDQLQSTPLWDAKAGLQTEKDKQDYERQQALSMYKRVLTNSDKREYVSTLLNKKQEAWEIDTTVGHLPKKKLAVARKDKLVAHNENARLKRFKESRKDANLCTVRVFNSMYAYFEGDGYQKKALSANNEEADPTLSAYTQKILSASFDPKMFTEEYFSEHAVEMYEMMCDLKDYTKLRDKFPVFFDSLPLEQVMQLEIRSGWATEYEAVFNALLRVHGLELQPSNKSTHQIALTSITNKRLLSQEQRTAKTQYEEAMNSLGEKVTREEITLAQKYVAREDIYAESIATAITQEIADHTTEYVSWGYGIQQAYREYRKTLDVRDRLLKRADRYLNQYNTQNKREKKRASGKIAWNNKQIGLVSEHADRYRDIIYYLSGLTLNVPEGAEDFLRREKKTEILEFVCSKMMIEGVVAEKEYRDLQENQLPRKEIARKKAEGVSKRIGEKYDAVQDFLHTRDVYRDHIREQRKDFTKAYLKLSKAEKKILREKKVYVHEKRTLENVNKYTALGPSHSNGMKSVGDAMRKYMPEAYT